MPTWIKKTEFAKLRGVTPQAVTAWIKRGKLKGCIRDGKINKEKAMVQVPELLSPTRQININKRWGKPNTQESDNPSKPIKKIKLPPEDIEKKVHKKADTSRNMSIPEAERIKKSFDAAIRKIEYEEKIGKLVNIDEVERRAFAAGAQIREQLESISVRVSPLVAVESSDFECRMIIQREVNQVLEGLSQVLAVGV